MSSENREEPMEQKDTRRITITAITIAIIIILAIICFGCSRKNDEPADEPSQSLEVLDGTDKWENNEPRNEDGYIEIPQYKALYISEEEPNAYLGNPPRNDVYFRYAIQDSEENTLYDSEAVIIPGKALEVNLYELLSPGEYDVNIIIDTYDMDTQAPCNGATQQCHITVYDTEYTIDMTDEIAE